MKEPRDSITALSLYVGISVCLFGRHVVHDPAHFFVGRGADPSAMMWLLVWWPYALIHRINPFLTQLVWSPVGVNLAWTTSIPAPSLLAFPVTYSFGPVVSYNVLSLIGPALSAWSAYYLCAHFAKAFWPAFAGGYIYGFSSYEVGQVLGGHLSLSLVFLLPLLVLLFLRLLNGAIKPRCFVVLFTLTLIMQFLVSNEIFATMTVFGLMTIALAWCLGDCASLRSRLPHAMAWVCVSYLLAFVILSPYLYYVFAYGMPHNPLYPPEDYSADLVSFILPNRLCFLTFRLFGIDGRRLVPDPWENGAYLGLPLVILGCWYLLENRRNPTAKVLAISLGLVLLATLGPVLHIAQRQSIALPWAAIVGLPLLKHALPGRFILYAFLELAVMASMWLARPGKPVAMKTAVLGLGVLFLWPSTSHSVVTAPPFFTSYAYKRYLRQNENVLIVPFGRNGESMLWQAQTLMYFKMAGGWLGPTPAEFEHWPIVQALFYSALVPGFDVQLKAFLVRHNIKTVLVADTTPGPWEQLFSTLDAAPMKIGNVSIYKVGDAAFKDYRDADAREMEGEVNLARFAELLTAANRYLAQEFKPEQLSVARLRQLGFLPDRGESQANEVGWVHSMWVGTVEKQRIGVSLTGYFAGLKPVIARYGHYAASVGFSYPDTVLPGLERDELGTLLMTFDRAQIASAVITELGEPPPGSPVSSKRFLASASTPPDPGLQARQIRRAGDNSAVTAHKTPRTESTRADLPVLTGINGVPVVATPANPAVGYAATQLPASRGRWRFWWREPQAEDTVVLSGDGFDTQNGIAVELFCDCPLGKVGPFFLQPAEHLFGKTTILLSLPAYGADAPPAGAGAFLVSNKGGAGHFSKTSNLVWVSVGVPGSEAVKASAPVVVGKVIQEGSTIRVEGSGFTSRTVINLFCGGRGDLNLGGLDPADHPKIPVTVYSSTLLSFKIPDGATSGPAYVQALKPPFRGGLGSGNGAGGSLVLQLPARADH